MELLDMATQVYPQILFDQRSGEIAEDPLNLNPCLRHCRYKNSIFRDEKMVEKRFRKL